MLEKLGDKTIVTILNKCDLPAKLDKSQLPGQLHDPVTTSTQTGRGIGELTNRIKKVSGCVDFNYKQPVCFTERQKRLLRLLGQAESTEPAQSVINELLNGEIIV